MCLTYASRPVRLFVLLSLGTVAVPSLLAAEKGKTSANHPPGYVPQREGLDPIFPITVSEVVLMGTYAKLPPLWHVSQRARRTAATLADEVAPDVLRAKHEELTEFVFSCALKGTSEEDQGIIGKGRRDEYIMCRDTLLDLGVARWRNPEKRSTGWDLVVTPEQAAEIIRRHIA